MAEEQPNRSDSRRRRTLRLCRRLGLVLLVVALGVVGYLNQVGLPGFVKEPLLAELRARGIAAEFNRLRWRWYEGIVAEDLAVRPAGRATGPEFHSAAARVRLEMESLLPPRWRIESLAVRDGQLAWILPDSSLPPLQLEAIEAGLALGSDGTLNLHHFSSRFADLQLKITGSLANARALNRPRDTPRPAPDIALLHRTMTQVADYLTNFTFTVAPTLELHFTADAADWASLRADLEISLPETRTTWGNAEDFRLLARVRPPSATNAEPSCVIQLAGQSLDTPWGRLGNWQAETLTVPVVQLPLNSSNTLHLRFAQLATRWGNVEDGSLRLVVPARDADRPGEIELNLDLTGQRFVTPQGTASRLGLASTGGFNRTNGLPLHGTHRLEVHDVQGTNFAAAVLQLGVVQKPTPPDRPARADDTWGFWRLLEPHQFEFELSGEAVAARGVKLEALKLAGDWAAPTLRLRELDTTLYGGKAHAAATVDIPSREIEARAEVGFDFHALDHVFTERFRNWFAPYQWQDTPQARVTGRLHWPDWRNWKPNWRAEVVPGIGISGDFRVKNASYKGIPGEEAFSNFHFTNFIWHLPNLTIVRPEGRVTASYDGDERTKDYVWQIRGNLNPHALKPLFKDRQLRAFDAFTNHVTPHVAGTIWGRWRAHERIGFAVEVSAPQLELRGEATDLVTATIRYTNQFLTIRNLEIQQSNQVGRAGALGFDFPNNVMFFTNVESRLPPQSVARAIGPVTARTVEPYVFTEPPRILVEGRLGLKGHDATDLNFDVAGGPFHWWRFHLAAIRGQLHWRSNHLALTGAEAEFYHGSATGNGEFQFFDRERPTEFRFTTVVTNAQLQPLGRDVFNKTNGIEGRLAGRLEITAGRADSLDTWQGFGDLHLRDGLLWDIPIFAIFSPVLNALSPGLGQSRADEALATFTIINGTVISRDLQVRSPELSMGYQGSVDFQGQLDARMQARILKDSGVLGPLISTVLWPLTKIFEYRLSGTLAEPVAEPIHIPRFLMMALEPFKALQGILKGVGEAVNPPKTEEPPPP